MSLKDELLKAKLISQKDLQRIEHEERIERQKLGKEGLQQKKASKDKAFEEQQEERKQRDREIVLKLSEQEKEERLQNLISKGRLQSSGNKKFYFVAKNGKIPFLLVNDDTAKNLQSGLVAIVETEQGSRTEFFLVKKEAADQIAKFSPESVRFQQEKGG